LIFRIVPRKPVDCSNIKLCGELFTVTQPA